ncbi:hypothetical protein HPB50_014139 [Hyalomma asiaticum]|uniref:Uncharacterized protein n=1 Tax=Hyalomma asiaticum TaxID=266040 RepID=A0ACB7RQW2_HYAAI|nr:hypothetical protein HPB50_014139 [Hyalomma asiaticum]
MAILEAEVQSYCAERRMQCTGNGSNGCQLLEHLTAVNELLLETGLQIEQDSSQPDGERMAVTRTLICQNTMWDKPRARLNNSSLKLAQTLILDHRSFTAIETYSTMPCPEVLGAFASVAHQCEKLQRLRLPGRRQVVGVALTQLDDTETVAPWLNALQKTRTLRELCIHLSGMTDAQCRSLFLGIAGNHALD